MVAHGAGERCVHGAAGATPQGMSGEEQVRLTKLAHGAG